MKPKVMILGSPKKDLKHKKDLQVQKTQVQALPKSKKMKLRIVLVLIPTAR